MDRFIIKFLFFSIFPVSTLYGVFLLENGTADPFYQRFTTPKQEALILGNSKAAQGIIPSILNEELKGIYDGKLYNYSFTVYNSPFGPAYLESVKRKLIDYEGKKCFIITVDPWSISSDINDPNNPEKFEENKRFISDINNVSTKPNLKYMLKWFLKSYYEIILMRLKNHLSFLNKDGWFKTGEQASFEVRNKQRNIMIDFYNGYLNRYSHSSKRFKYLDNTIEYLNRNGTVFLIRMPLHEDILKIEEKVDPNFGFRMQFLSQKHNVIFIDFNQIEKEYTFKDGLHFDVESAVNFTLELSCLITNYQKNSREYANSKK
ncbi:hypothetical protein LZF95_05500 [Algoriphagus sp. AGSA1]|uniref:hypothetical protein n=1 Tax=Algoriphagus sp. AGSA1 TaxID=2907213 RepID=UPI001F26F0F3|nr:hypothetical protein [Algoriphagus sp. AGSA1]MCE7054121.1 hypothetical protein [Algoriphagus sp. AGSA1]